MKLKLLLIEDEPGLILTLTDRLTVEGYSVETAEDGVLGFQKAISVSFDLIILDVMLPGKNGFDIVRDLRSQGIETPVIMLTARGQVIDKVLGLKLGADDYLTKPFEMMELLARLESIIRRIPSSKSDKSPEILKINSITIDFKKAEVTGENGKIEFSAQEFRLLRYFVSHEGQVLSREELLNEVWGYGEMPTTRTVDVHVAWLRQKLEPNPKLPASILTVHGIGYKFVST